VDAPSLPAPSAHDRGELCLDVADVRACWGSDAGDGALVPRSLPSGLTPRAGLRCHGRAQARRCVARSVDAGPFVCRGARCNQARPRTPDSGEWECVDLRGAVVCRDAGPAAGVPRGELDPAFSCGIRRGHGERICLDFAPDRPADDGVYACAAHYETGVSERRCEPAKSPQLGSPCRADAGCPDGAHCLGERCLPPRPRAECWLDADCGAGSRCRFGSCT